MTCNNNQYHQALQTLRDSIDLALNQFDADVHESLSSYSTLNEDTDNPTAVPGFEVVTTPGLYPENITIDSNVDINLDVHNVPASVNTDDVITFTTNNDDDVVTFG